MCFKNAALNLALSLAPYPQTDDMRALAGLLLSEFVNWKEFLFWVKRHGIWGLVLENMQAIGEEKFPQHVFRQIKRYQLQSSLQNMRLLVLLGQIKSLFESQNLEFVILKGPLLSHLLYDSFNLRLSTDIDLLVCPADFPRADMLLRSSGYPCFEPSFALSPLLNRIYAQYRHHYSYRQSDKSISIELHWSLAEPYYLSSQISQSWMSRARQVHVPGLTVDVLSNEDLLVYVLLHGAKHRWSSAKHLLDLLAVLRLPYDFDWQRVDESLRLARLQRVAAQGLALLQTLWGFSAPEPLQSIARPNAASRFLSGFSLELLGWPEVEKREDPRWFMYGLLLKPGLIYPAYYLSKTLAAPLINHVKK